MLKGEDGKLVKASHGVYIKKGGEYVLSKSEGDYAVTMPPTKKILEKAKKTDDDDDTPKKGKKKMPIPPKKGKGKKSVDVPETDDDDDVEEKCMDKGKKGNMKKAIKSERLIKVKVDSGYKEIMKALKNTGSLNDERFGAIGELLGDMTKRQRQFQKSIKEELQVIKSQPGQRKSLVSARQKFKKGRKETKLELGKNVMSLGRSKGAIMNLLNSHLFIKGTDKMDAQFEKAITLYDASHTLPENIIKSLEQEEGIKFIA